MTVPAKVPEGVPPEEGLGIPIGDGGASARLSRLTKSALALSFLGLLVLIGLAVAALAVEWEFITERRVITVAVILLSVLIVFLAGLLLGVVSLFRRRQAWRSAMLALGLNLFGLGAMFYIGYMIVAVMAAAAVGAVQAALGGLMVLLMMIFAWRGRGWRRWLLWSVPGSRGSPSRNGWTHPSTVTRAFSTAAVSRGCLGRTCTQGSKVPLFSTSAATSCTVGMRWSGKTSGVSR